MAQTVSNDALWEKLSEIDRTLNELTKTHKSSSQTPEQVALKDEIIAKIEEYAYKLGQKSKMYSEANRQDTKKLTGDLLMLAEMIACISDRQQVYFESQKEDKETYLNFKLFKVRKTTTAIAILSVLVFILTLSCIKQRSSYALLNEEFIQQETTIKEIQAEADSLRAMRPKGAKKK